MTQKANTFSDHVTIFWKRFNFFLYIASSRNCARSKFADLYKNQVKHPIGFFEWLLFREHWIGLRCEWSYVSFDEWKLNRKSLAWGPFLKRNKIVFLSKCSFLLFFWSISYLLNVWSISKQKKNISFRKTEAKIVEKNVCELNGLVFPKKKKKKKRKSNTQSNVIQIDLLLCISLMTAIEALALRRRT